MLIQSLLTGFLSVLTPTVVFMIALLMISFNNFNTTTKGYLLNIIGFGTIIIGFFLLLRLLVSNYSIDIFSITNSNIGFKIVLTILQLVFGLWIFGVLKIESKSVVIKRFLWVLIVVLTGIIFSFSTLSSTKPILGAIIVSSKSSDSLLSIFLPLFGFAFGLTVAVGLILILTSRLIKRLSNKKWWKIVQLAFGSLYLVLVIIGLISFINVT
jgi:cytochrome c biogenesis protein CcdA